MWDDYKAALSVDMRGSCTQSFELIGHVSVQCSSLKVCVLPKLEEDPVPVIKKHCSVVLLFLSIESELHV